MLKRIFIIIYGVIGVIVGGILLWYMSPHFYHALDRSFTRSERDIQAVVLSSKMSGMYKNREYKVVLMPKKKYSDFPHKKIIVNNEKFFNYVQRKINPPYSLTVDITVAKQWLSGKTIVVMAGPVRIPHREKNSRLLLFLIMTILGAAVIFAAIKDSYKRCQKLRRESWDPKATLSAEKPSSEEETSHP